MSLFKRYRRITMTRALKPWTPVFALDVDEVAESMVRSRL